MAISNPFYLMAILYFVVDAIALALLAFVTAGWLPAIPALSWLRIHLLTVGVVTQVILGALPGLVAGKVGTTQPGSRTIGATWLLLNVSLVGLLVGMPGGGAVLAAGSAAGVLVAAGLVGFSIYQWGAGPSFGRRADARLYAAAFVFLLFGLLFALSMLLGWPAPGGYAGVKESHMHANVFGFVGLVAAAVLLELIPARVGRPLRFPRLVPWTSSLLTIGGVGLSAGPWLALMPLTVLGLVTYIVGSATLLANLVGTVLGYRAWTPNLAHVLAAYVWMFVPFVVAPTVLITTGELPSGAVEAAAVTSFIGGWLLQIVIGAFLARAPAGAAGTPNGEGSWFAVTVLNLGVAVTWAGAFVPTAVWAPVTALGYGLVVIGWLPPLGAVLHWLSSIER